MKIELCGGNGKIYVDLVSISLHISQFFYTFAAMKSYKIEFFDDSQSPDLEKRREGSSFMITADDDESEPCLRLYKNNWGNPVDYLISEDGFVETIRSVKGDDLTRLMQLCDNSETVAQVADYIYKRFSPDGYNACLHILEWLEDNHIETLFWSWP